MYASSAKNEKGEQEEDALEDIIQKMTYSGEFTNNLLVVGQTGSGKTVYVENLIECGFVRGNKLIWVSSEVLTRTTREAYHKRFKSFETFAFFQARDKKDLTLLLNDMEGDIRKNHEDTDHQTVIVFDDLLNIADKCEAYSTFLSTCRHIGVRTINMFQGFRNCDKWDNIKANCQTVVVFKLGWLAHRLISQITNVAIRGDRVVPKRSRWLYKVYQDHVMGKGNYNHLMVDLRSESENNLTCFRSQTDNPRVQVCYFDAGNQTDYQMFHAARVININNRNNEQEEDENVDDSMKFKIVSVIQHRSLKSKDKPRKGESSSSRKRKYSDIDSDISDDSDYAEDIESTQGFSSHDSRKNRPQRSNRYYADSRKLPQPRLSNGRYASPMYLSNNNNRRDGYTSYDDDSSSSYVSSDDGGSSTYNRKTGGGRSSGQQINRRNARSHRPEYTDFINDRYTPAYV